MQLLKEVVKEIKESQYPFYVYILYRPDLTPFYVGKGKVVKKSVRILWHEYEAALEKPPKSNSFWNALKVNIIRKIWRQGEQVQYAIDSWHQKESDSYVREMELIQHYGRRIVDGGLLSNISEGGGSESIPHETRQKISDSLKRYYEDNPEALEEMSRKAKERCNTPESREQARQRAIDNKSHENIIRWLEEEPEACREKWDRHSDDMKQWYKNNPDKAEQLAINRNKILKCDDHRKKMSGRTKAYMDANPDVASARVEAMQKATQEKVEIKQECLQLVQTRLLQLGEISDTKIVSAKILYRWRKRGLIQKHFPKMPFGHAKKSDWVSFKEKLNESNVS